MSRVLEDAGEIILIDEVSNINSVGSDYSFGHRVRNSFVFFAKYKDCSVMFINTKLVQDINNFDDMKGETYCQESKLKTNGKLRHSIYFQFQVRFYISETTDGCSPPAEKSPATIALNLT